VRLQSQKYEVRSIRVQTMDYDDLRIEEGDCLIIRGFGLPELSIQSKYLAQGPQQSPVQMESGKAGSWAKLQVVSNAVGFPRIWPGALCRRL
jgi:hypothetical protein